MEQAITAYSKGIDEWEDGVDPNLKATILSNRAACYLKAGGLEKCTQDCTKALEVVKDDTIRCKVLYRRAKAWFLLTETNKGRKTVLQDAAKDLLQLLSIEPKNKEAGILLKAIRAKHDLTKGTPMSQTLDALKEAETEEERVQQFNILLGLMTNDEKSAPMEFGARGGVQFMMGYGSVKSLQVLACASSSPKFVKEYGRDISQDELTGFATTAERGLLMACLSVWLRLVLYLDPLESLDDVSLIDSRLLMQSCMAATSDALLPATLNVLSTWTAVDRQAVVMSSTAENILRKHSESELRRMKPREVAGIKKVDYERIKRDQMWANRRAMQFCTEGGMATLLNASVESKNHNLRKQVGVVLGRILSSIQEEEDVKKVVKPLLGEDGATIEEVDEEKDEGMMDRERLRDLMTRAQLVSSLLLGQAEVGAWALDNMRHELSDLIRSDGLTGMAIVSELVSAAASVEKARPTISSMFTAGSFQTLLEHPEHDVRSGAASAIAKLGLADKNLDTNEGDVMALLQIAAELLNDDESGMEGSDLIAKTTGIANQSGTSIERGVEVIGYLSSKTQVKDELAYGFKVMGARQTVLERLVELADAPNAGESVSAFAIATTFSLICVSNETLRKESFEGKEITMEQYDEMQALGKTDEEKENMVKMPEDSQNAVEERIRKLANANVPRAMVKLLEGASESTMERLAIGMNRMAVDAAVRGLLIQQGVLSACIKVEDTEHSTETKKNALRQARHCVAKLLVTTNPSMLTTSQRIGAIKPVILLIRDSDASDLQHFEALLAVTNIASTGYDAKEKVVSEKGVSTISYAMFSDHELVRRAGTEAMCNLVGHPAMEKHLSDPENLRLWLAFAADFENNFECARAASGCLAMSTDIPDIAGALIGLKTFKECITSLLESGNLELMHRTLVLIKNLIDLGDKYKECVTSAGLVTFCRVYAESYHDGAKAADLGFSPDEQGLMSVTLDLAKTIAIVEN